MFVFCLNGTWIFEKGDFVKRAFCLLLTAIVIGPVFWVATTHQESQTRKNGMNENIYTAVQANPTTLVIHCSDPRFQVAFGEFIQKGLRLSQGQFVPIIVGGGPASLVHLEMTNNLSYLNGQIRFFLHHCPNIGRIVVINHEDCGYYKTIPGRPNEKDDLTNIVGALTADMGDMEIVAYYARFTDDSHTATAFERL